MGKPLTLEERKAIQRELEAGATLADIARSLRRSPNGLHYEINKYGNTQGYDAQKAHDATIAIRAEKHRKIAESLRDKKRRDTESFNIKLVGVTERMDMLDMQIEILIDKIGELEKKYGEN